MTKKKEGERTLIDAAIGLAGVWKLWP